MRLVHITCITLTHRSGGHQQIVGLGNSESTWSVEAIVSNIQAREATYVIASGCENKTAEIAVVREVGKKPYLRARFEDGRYNDLLLTLPPCESNDRSYAAGAAPAYGAVRGR